MPDWRLQHLRISVFSDRTNPVEHSDGLYLALTGAEYEVDERRGPHGAFRRRAGTVDGRRVEVVEQPLRVDFSLLGPTDLQLAAIAGDLGLSALGDLDQLEALLAGAPVLFEQMQRIIRVAIGGLLFAENQTREDSYAVLGELVPDLDLDPMRTDDFALQVNRFRSARAVEGLRLNRLAQRQSMTALMTTGAVPQMPGSQPVLYWVQQALDVNTDGNNLNPFTPEQLHSIWSELKENFMELSQGFR